MDIFKKIVGFFILISSIFGIMFSISYFLIIPSHNEREAIDRFKTKIAPEVNSQEVQDIETSVTGLGGSTSLIVFGYKTATPQELSFVRSSEFNENWVQQKEVDLGMCEWVTDGDKRPSDYAVFSRSITSNQKTVSAHICFNLRSKKAVYTEES